LKIGGERGHHGPEEKEVAEEKDTVLNEYMRQARTVLDRENKGKPTFIF